MKRVFIPCSFSTAAASRRCRRLDFHWKRKYDGLLPTEILNAKSGTLPVDQGAQFSVVRRCSQLGLTMRRAGHVKRIIAGPALFHNTRYAISALGTG
jgi:hypothetical protein